MQCVACQHSNPPRSRFCNQCGAVLDVPTPSEPERRQLTVMFCDLVGSTEMSTRLDPEELRAVILAYRRAVVDIVTMLDGEVAQFLGDGVLVYFGYPAAHEDDAERAVRAALRIMSSLTALKAPGDTVRARIGIATGLVVASAQIGHASPGESLAVGQTPNLAARLQQTAGPGRIVVAESTRRLLGRMFEVRELQPVTVKGFGQPVAAFEIVAEAGSISRFEDMRRPQRTSFVGREFEMTMLQNAWAEARIGRGSTVLISGEAGIGKSRLTVSFVDTIKSEPNFVLKCSCSPHHTDTPLYPFIALVENLAGVTIGDTRDARRSKLQTLLGSLVMGPASNDASLLAEVLGMSTAGEVETAFSPNERKAALFRIFVDVLVRYSQDRPVVFIAEDVHWADATSRDLLDRLVDIGTTQSVLLIYTFRPELVFPEAGRTGVLSIALPGLAPSSAATMVSYAAQHHPLSTDLIERIVASADGVPLFIEELTHAVVESGVTDTGASRWSSDIPDTLQGLLVARLDRLGSAKDVAQIGAVIGRVFSVALLRELADRDDRSLTGALEDLVHSGLVASRGDETYKFKHALVCDAAYDTLLKSRRRVLHERLATTIERRFPVLADTKPELVAHHYACAEQAFPAAAFFLKAGQIASDRSANAEVVAHMKRAIALLSLQPESPERNCRELELQCVLGPAFAAAAGYSAPETGAAFARAAELMKMTGDFTHEDAILVGLSTAHFNRAQYAESLAIRRRLLTKSQRRNDTTGLCIALRGVASVENIFGEFERAQTHAEQALGLYEPDRHGPLAWRYVHDLGVAAACQLAIALWHRGETGRSFALFDETVARAKVLGHKNTIGYAFVYQGLLSFVARDHDLGLRCSGELGRLGHEEKMPQWTAWSRGIALTALAAKGEGAAALDKAASFGAWKDSVGNAAHDATLLFGLAQVYFYVGRFDEALSTLDKSEALAAANGERWVDADMARLRGDLILADRGAAGIAEAEACFLKALAIARRQGSKAYELRATTSLAQLMAELGRRSEARDLLAPFFGSISNNFDAGHPIAAGYERAAAQKLLVALG